jgi:type II secretory pathway pseudopilin PulG
MKLARQRIKARAAQATASGFTLAEVLAALVFMAIVIPVALSGLSVASRAGEVSVRKAEAALVAERVLNENVLLTNYSTALQSGSVRQGLKDFRWSVRSEPWYEDPYARDMRLLTVDVAYAVQGRDCSVQLSTLVDSAGGFGTNFQQQ